MVIKALFILFFVISLLADTQGQDSQKVGPDTGGIVGEVIKVPLSKPGDGQIMGDRFVSQKLGFEITKPKGWEFKEPIQDFLFCTNLFHRETLLNVMIAVVPSLVIPEANPCKAGPKPGSTINLGPLSKMVGGSKFIEAHSMRVGNLDGCQLVYAMPQLGMKIKMSLVMIKSGESIFVFTAMVPTNQYESSRKELVKLLDTFELLK